MFAAAYRTIICTYNTTGCDNTIIPASGRDRAAERAVLNCTVIAHPCDPAGFRISTRRFRRNTAADAQVLHDTACANIAKQPGVCIIAIDIQPGNGVPFAVEDAGKLVVVIADGRPAIAVATTQVDVGSQPVAAVEGKAFILADLFQVVRGLDFNDSALRRRRRRQQGQQQGQRKKNRDRLAHVLHRLSSDLRMVPFASLTHYIAVSPNAQHNI